MKKTQHTLNTIVLSTIVLALPSQAAQPTKYPVGDYEFTAEVNVNLEYDDNIFRDDENEVDSFIGRVTPTLRLANETPQRRLAVYYGGEYSVFFDSSDDNFITHEVGVEGEHSFSRFSRAGGYATFEDGNERRGTGSSDLGLADDFDEPTPFTDFNVGVYFDFGSQGSRSKFNLAVDYQELDFDNFFEVTAGREREVIGVSGSYSFRFSPATYAFIDVNTRNIDFVAENINLGVELDNQQTTVQAGIEWSISRLTKGRVGVGITDNDFDAGILNTGDADPTNDIDLDSTDFTWNAAIEWTPSRNDVVTLETVRSPQQSSGVGAFVDQSRYSLGWARRLTDAWNFEGSFSFVNSDFEDAGREDDNFSISAGIGYSFNRRADLSLRYVFENRDSSDAQFDFNRNIIGLLLNIGI